MSSNIINPSFECKYAPERLSDVVFPDDHIKQTLDMYVAGHTRKPVLFYGPYGTGKTTIANLLPYAMVSDLQSVDVMLVRADGRNNIAEQLDKIENFASTMPFHSGDIRFVIIDEIDNLNANIQKSLKSHIDAYKNFALFMFTTNFIQKMDPGLRSRSEQLFIGSVNAERWLSRMRHILAKENVPVPAEASLLKMAQTSKGDARSLLSTLQRYALRYRASIAPKPTAPASIVNFPEEKGTTDAAAK